MSDEIKVKIVKDEGHKERWGLDSIIYRKEGKKLSLNTKLTAWIVGLSCAGGGTYSVVGEFFQPTPTDNPKPIGFNGEMSDDSNSKVQVPVGNSEYNKPKAPTKTKVVVHYSSPQIIGRPSFGKIPPGSMVKAKFMTGATNGPLKAKLIEPLTSNGEELLPEGVVLIGNGSSTDDRLIVQFSKLVLKDGKAESIQAQSCDIEDQTVGVKGKKISKYAALVATGAGLNFLGGLAEGLQERESTNGVIGKKTDLRNAALNGASKAALDQSQEVLTELKNKKSVIQVDSGKEFYVLFEGE